VTQSQEPLPVSQPDDQPQLSDGDRSPEEEGRIGYGRYGRYTPLALALLLAAILLGIGLMQRDPGSDLPAAPSIAGTPAPGFTLTLLDGSTFTLADHLGKVVVVNFWGSWCAPCKEEMPAFQRVSQELGDGVVIVGVGIKNDNDANARALVEELGLTYPIGRDTEGSNPVQGPIEAAYGISTYPASLFIRPDGTVFAVRLGAMDDAEIEKWIEQAGQPAAQ